MGLTLSQSVYWAASSAVEVAILILAIRRRAFRIVPVFSIYISLLVANEAIMFVTYSIFGLNSLPSLRTYWTMQALDISVRAAVVYEICWILLSRFTGVWRVCRSFLYASAAILIAAAAYASSADAASRISATILAGERGLEIAILAILLLGVFFCWYFKFPVRRHLGLLALGFGFYSAIEVANNTFLKDSSLANFHMWEILRSSSFLIGALFWLAALWKPLPLQQEAPVVLSQERYAELAPEVSRRLLELNTRLLEMWK